MRIKTKRVQFFDMELNKAVYSSPPFNEADFLRILLSNEIKACCSCGAEKDDLHSGVCFKCSFWIMQRAGIVWDKRNRSVVWIM